MKRNNLNSVTVVSLISCFYLLTCFYAFVKGQLQLKYLSLSDSVKNDQTYERHIEVL